MVPPAATMSSHSVNVAGMPTASMAVSTPRPPVSAVTCCAASPLAWWLLSTVAVAPNRFATANLSSFTSIMMISDGA